MLVVDNIEVHPNYERFKPFLKSFYHQIIEDLMPNYQAKMTVQGCSYNDLELYDENAQDGRLSTIQVVGNSEGLARGRFYTDAKRFKVIAGEASLFQPLIAMNQEENYPIRHVI